MHIRTTFMVPALAAMLLLSGCLVVTTTTLDERGTRISPQTLDQITPGVTTKGWLLATLGEPTSRTTVDDQPNVELLRYTHTEHKSERGAVFLLFGGRSDRRTTHTTYFEVTDGIVTRHWTEQ